MKIINKITTLILIFSFLMTSGFGCKVVDKKTKLAMTPITLNYWRVWDDEDAFEEIIENYQKLHPFVTINYKKLRYQEYEQKLLEAMSEDRGPDIFSIHAAWVKKYRNKITPLPPATTMAVPIKKGTIKQEVIPELRTTKTVTLRELKNRFVDTIFDDVVIEKKEEDKSISRKIMALPLATDNLVMYYNRDLLNNAGVPEPPKYWNRDFQKMIKNLTKIDYEGNILQSGVAMGGSDNIERYSDIISILMMQNGAIMLDAKDSVSFHKIPKNLKGQDYHPGIEALRFYTDFSNESKEVYCWNDKLENSIDLFTQGKLAIMFGYSYHLPTIQTRAPKINLGIARLPQIEDSEEINIANYWVETVSKKSKHSEAAWDFLHFMTTNEKQVKIYLNNTKKPTALRSLIDEQKNDDHLATFASQILTAKNWYRGEDYNAAEFIMKGMIDDVINGKEKINTALNLAARRIQETIIKKDKD